MYDQNRPEEPQRPAGDEKPARRRLGRSWGPAEEPAEAEEPGRVGQAQQGYGQAPEQYRFDPDRGRRHRYSEEPTGQVPNVPVEIAETGPTVPATRRPAPGEQFDPIPQAPHRRQDQLRTQQDSQFAPPGANQGPSAPPQGANHPPSAPPQGADNAVGTPPNRGDAPSEPPSAPPQGTNQRQHGTPSPPAPGAPDGSHQAPPATPAQPPSEAEPGPHTGPQQVAEGFRQETPSRTPSPDPTPTPSTPPLPSPPVTEQAPPRTPPAPRQPVAEPTPPVSPDEEPAGGDEPLLAAVRQVPGVRDAYHVTARDGGSSLRLELEDGVDPDAVHAAVSAVVAEHRATDPGPQTTDEDGEQPRAELEPAEPAEAELPVVGAVELQRVEIDSSGLDAEVGVTLAIGGHESAGAVTVPPIDWHVQHAAAAATVEALRPYFGATETRVEVEHASIVTTGPVKTAVVTVLWMDGTSVRRLAGAAVVTAERSRAVVSATLSALAAEVAH
ncbi:hypothetical protein [Glycomyces xiaoerkulensis]|uniref:hypothetical protein n=1 Tax=Glycomyces xiaoerkulensis TaxID=2038139 RepID=UPI000C257610|nr:hypothetical protein [Glycomyces xiaoerkulensis]